MKKSAIVAAVLTAAGLTTVGVSAANAAPAPPAFVCRHATLAPGTYDRVTVVGGCSVGAGTVRVLDRVTVRSGAELDVNAGANFKVGANLNLHSGATYRNFAGSRTHVFGSVTVTSAQLGADAQDAVFKVDGDINASGGAVVALGCTPAHPCAGGGPAPTANAASVPFVQLPALDTVVVGGSVYLDNVFNAAFNGVTIHGSLISNGGGAGPLDPNVEFIPFSVKDDVILGDVQISGLNTVWFGVLRSRITGSVTLTDVQNTDPDGNEVVANKIVGDLSCTGNAPASQFGDAVEDGPFPGYGPNKVGGTASGQCADLTHLPAG